MLFGASFWNFGLPRKNKSLSPGLRDFRDYETRYFLAFSNPDSDRKDWGIFEISRSGFFRYPNPRILQIFGIFSVSRSPDFFNFRDFSLYPKIEDYDS